MDMLKKFFPYSFAPKNGIAGLIINILVYLVAEIIIGAVIGILSLIPIVNIIVGAVGSLVSLYVLVGIVLSCLDYFKVLK